VATSSNEYLIPLGTDLSPLVDGIREAKKFILDLNTTAKESGDNMKDAFGTVNQITQKFSTETVKGIKAISDQAAALKGNEAQIKSFTTLVGQLGKDQTNLINLLAKGAQNLDKTKLTNLQKQLEGVNSSMDQLKIVVDFIKKNIDDFKFNPQEVKQLTENIATLEGVFSKLGDSQEETEKKSVSLRAQLRALKQELATIDDPSDPRFVQLASQAAVLEDKIGDVNKQVKLLSSDTRSLDAGFQAIQGLVGVFAAAQGAVALFGSENEDLQKTLLKVNAAMAILQGLQQVGQLLDKNSALNLFLIKTLRLQDAAAMGVETAATETATSAQVGLNVAMLANPAGILLLSIGALIAVFTLFSSAAERVTRAHSQLNAELEVGASLANTEIDAIRKSGDLHVAELEKRKAKDSEVTNAQLDNIDQQIERAKTQYDDASANFEKFDIKRTKSDAKYGEQYLRAEKINSDAATKFYDLVDERQKLSLQLSEKLRQEDLQSAIAVAETKLANSRKGSEDELAAQKEVITAKAALDISEAKLPEETERIRAQAKKAIRDADREFAIQSLEDQKSRQQAALDLAIQGSKEELDARIKVLQLEADIEIKQAQGNQAKIREAEAKLEKERRDAIIAFIKQRGTSLLDTEISETNAQLSLVREGTEQELVLRKKLIDEQAELDITAANADIKNEKEREAKVIELRKKANRDKLDLDKQFLEKSVSQNSQINQGLVDLEIELLKIRANSPLTDPEQRFRLEQDIREKELIKVKGEIDDLKKLHDAGVLDEKDYQSRLIGLQKEGQRIRGEIQNAELAHFEQFNIKEKILKAIGLNPNDPAVKEFVADFTSAVSAAVSNLSKFMEDQAQAQIASIQKVVDALNEQISQQQQVVDEQKALSDKGLANDLDNQQKKLDDLKAKKDEEILEQKKAQEEFAKIKREEAIVQSASIVASNIETGVDMVNAAAKIFKAHSGIPFVGVALAVGLTALMLSTFLSIKNAINAAQSDVPKFKGGGGFFLDGPSHEDGGIGLYNENTGKKIAEYEGNEYLFAINKKASSKYRPLLEMINEDRLPASHANDIASIINSPYRLPDVTDFLAMQRKVQQSDISQQAALASLANTSLLKKISRDLEEWKRFDMERLEVYDMGDHILIKDGHYTKKIKKENS
jgi:hypothetical protein